MSLPTSKTNNQNHDSEENITLAGKRFLTAAQVAQIIGKHPKWLEQIGRAHV